MKKFLQIDFYLQISLLIGTLLVLVIISIIEKSWDKMFFFYWIVGGVQLLSFLIRHFLKYQKSKFYNSYKVLIIPVWVILFFAFILQGTNFSLGNEPNQIAGIFLFYLYLSLFFSPIMAIIYVYDCYQTYKNYEKSHL